MTNIAERLKRGEKITGYLNQIFTCCLFVERERNYRTLKLDMYPLMFPTWFGKSETAGQKMVSNVVSFSQEK